MIKYTSTDIGGKIVKSNEVYTIYDNSYLSNLVLSQTILHVGKETTGHSHPGQEEVYFFVSGTGKMIVDHFAFYHEIEVKSGDIVLIPDGAFHKVYNTGSSDLIFNCVFDGKRNH